MALIHIATQSIQNADTGRKMATRSHKPKNRPSKMCSSNDVKGKKREQVNGEEINSVQSPIPFPSPDAHAAPVQPDAIAVPTPGTSASTSAAGGVRHGVKQNQDFIAFGVNAYPTRAIHPSICFYDVLPWTRCIRERSCSKVHPKDKDLYFRKMSDVLSLNSSDSGNSSVLAEPDKQTTISLSTTESVSHSSTQDQSPIRQPASNIRGDSWDPTSFHWESGSDQSAWSTEDSRSSGPSEEIYPTISKAVHSRNSSDTEDDNRNQSRHTSPITRFSRELCWNFLQGRCSRGLSCRYYHDELQVPTTLAVSKFPITGIGTPKSQGSSHSDAGQILPPSEIKVLHPRPPVDEVCRKSLRGQCQRGYRCNYIHEDIEYDESLPRRPFWQGPFQDLRLQGPRVETPRVEAPRAEGSRVEVPRREASRVQAPRVEIPRVETPRAETVQVEASRVEAPPEVKAPRAEASRADITPVEASRPKAPLVEAYRIPPRFQALQAQALQTQALQAQALQAQAPQVEAPRARAPRVEAPSSAEVAQPSPLTNTKVRHPRPPSDDVCRDWLRGDCSRGYHCTYIHRDLEYDESIPRRQPAQTAQQAPTADVGQPSPPTDPKVRHPRPPFDDVCRVWLRGECTRGYRCNHVHQDLEYDESIPRRELFEVPARTPPEFFSTTIYKHIKIKVTDGCEVTEVTTGFETSWIYIGNVPRQVTQDELASLLQKHGELIDLRLPENSPGLLVTAKARFSSAAEASRVCSNLNGLDVFDSTLTAKLTINASSAASTTLLHDTSVRVSWEAPSKTAYAGFSTKEASLDALNKARSTPLGKHLLKAAVHTGLPSVGRFNICFDGVPADIDTEEMKAFSGADGIMWGKVNYTSHYQALNGIQRLLKESGADMLGFEVMPPPYKHGLIVSWAHLASSADAKKLCDFTHGRKPAFTGLTRISARHIHSLEYSLAPEVYANVKQEIDDLAARAWGMGRLSVTCRTHPTHVTVRLGAEDTQGLSKLKGEVDIILSGEVVRDNGKVVWHWLFTRISGQAFISSLERLHSPLKIRIDNVRKMIRLFGVSTARSTARMKITERVAELSKQAVHTIALEGRLFGVFMNDGLQGLQSELGEDAVHLDLWNRGLIVRGNQHAYDTALDAVLRARRTQIPSQLPGILCPVCFDQVSAPVTLCCGHSWCKTCITRYIMTAVDEKFFPLTCLGDDGKCQEKIPLSCARQLLPAADFEAVIESAFSAHINRHLDEFCFCPTPDCPQIYRRIPRVEVSKSSLKSQRKSGKSTTKKAPPVSVGTTLQCPSCLVRICASCQTEAHDGLACVRPEEGDSLFDEWMKNNDVKPCPGCKMPIEKVMGCHHVTCTVCSTHLCWVCLMPFDDSAGVYGHMLAIHGSFV